MSVGTADLYKALNVAWDASDLDDLFKALWLPAAVIADEYPVLNDQEGLGGQPWPYVVIDEVGSSTVSRMSYGPDSLYEIRDVEVRFNVHARDIESDSRGAKEIAAYLAEEIMKVFGGHPTVNPTGSMALDNGDHLITQFQNDYCIRDGDDEYMWIVQYLFRLDVPVAV